MSATTSPVADLIDLADRLSDLLAEESAMLRAAKAAEVAALQPDKSRLAHAFESKFAQFTQDKALLGAAEPAVVAALRRAIAQVHRVLAENAAMLRAARDANQRLIGAIMKALSERRNRFESYTAGAGRSPCVYAGRPTSNPVSLTIDQRL